MAVYLGNFGRIALRRRFDESKGTLYSVINPSDINTDLDRFSFDFDQSTLITGDQLLLFTTDGTTLDFVAASGWSNNTRQNSGTWFVNVDEVGGVRLYRTLAYALAGGQANAIQLSSIARNIPVRGYVDNTAQRTLGEITSYELNTTRETIDITTLSDDFRQQYSSIMSGSGRISCQWDYKDNCGDGTYETPHYLLQLLLRVDVGSEFVADLYLKQANYNPAGSSTSGDSIFYRVIGVLTACAIQVAPGNILEMTAEFITTGSVRLLTDIDNEDNLLLESGDKIKLEQDAASFLAARDRIT
jgi:hypothetical protein